MSMHANQIVKKYGNEKFPSLRENNPSKVEEYSEKMKLGTKFPPVLVGEWPVDETYGAYAIIDGNHRLEAAMDADKVIDVEFKKFASVAEALTYAYTANMAHGIPVAEGSRNKRIRLLKKLDPSLTWQKAEEIFKISKATFYDILKNEQRGEKSGRKKGTKVSKSAAHKNQEPLEEKPFFKYLDRIEETLGKKKSFNDLVAHLTPAVDPKDDSKGVRLETAIVKTCKSVIAGLGQLIALAEKEVK